MGLFDLFKKKKQPLEASPSDEDRSKEDFYKALLESMKQQSPSEFFAAGAVFDIVWKQHEEFEKCVRAGDVAELHRLLAVAYVTLLRNPTLVGVSPLSVNAEKNDTDFREWNTDTFHFPDGAAMGLCFMPVKDGALSARIIGMIFSDHGDGFYYCMLDKDENVPSKVIRNRGRFIPKAAGEVTGRGFELMVAFRDCITEDYHSDCAVDYIKESWKEIEGR